MDDCLFCKIADKKIPAKIRFENEDFIAFDDINPKAPVHILLVPKKHIHSIAALENSDRDLISEMIFKAKEIAREAGIANGFRLVFNSGPDAGQEVDHIHLHILGGKKLGSIA